MQKILNDLITLVGYTEADAQTLRAVSGQTQLWATAVSTAFYDTVYAYPPTAAVFQKGERPAREETLIQWYTLLVSGLIDDDFWQWQWYVGLIHIPRGIRNAYMMGMMSRLQQLFGQQCLRTFDSEQALAVYTAFKRVTDVVAGLIAESYFESYIEAVERATTETKYTLDRRVEAAIAEMVAEAQGVRL